MSQHRPIKAIETRYKGFRFRSRLEARWAIFLDTLEIPWEYEIEGFDLGNGVKYLPDFYLPAHDVFVEVKSSLPNISKIEWEKIARFVAYKKLILATGMPGLANSYLLEDSPELSELLLEILSESTQGSFPENFMSLIGDFHRLCLIPCGEKQMVALPKNKEGWGFTHLGLSEWHIHNLFKAIIEARSARFEFGKKEGQQ